MRNTAKVNGYIRATSSSQHPLHTSLSLILTDFAPNGNKQGIPLTEKQNIIATAQNTPFKINFDGVEYYGHTGAIPIGTIVKAFEGNDNGRDVILGEAVIWNDLYEGASDHMKAAFAEGIGTSWEIYYEDSTVDGEGVEWLSDCVFAGTCVVETPAYGPNRTRILAIAEKLNEVKEHMSVTDKVEAEDLTTTRNDLNEASDLLFKLWEGLDNLYTKTFEIEQATVETDIGKIAASFAERIAKIADHIASLSDKLGLSTAEQEKLQNDLTSVTAERDTLKQEKETAARAALEATRRAKLTEVGIEITDEDSEKLQRYVSMSEEMFDALIADIGSVSKRSTAEKKDPIIPEPLSEKKEYTTQEIGAELRQHINSKNKRG